MICQSSSTSYRRILSTFGLGMLLIFQQTNVAQDIGTTINDQKKLSDSNNADENFEFSQQVPVAPLPLSGAAGFSKDRYVSFDPNTSDGEAVAIRVSRVGGMNKYIDCTSLTDLGADGFYAKLIDGPLPLPGDSTYYCDWSGVTTGLHVRGCIVVPGNMYNVDMTTDGDMFSSALTIPTTSPQDPFRSFGDLVGVLIDSTWTAPDTIVTSNDIVAVMDKFTLNPMAPITARVDTDGNVPDTFINGADILRSVRAFAGHQFGFGVTDCLTGTCLPPMNCANDTIVNQGNTVFDLVPIGSTGPVTNLSGNSIEIPIGGVIIELELHVSGWKTTGDGDLMALQATIDGSGYCSGVGDPLNPLGYPGAALLACPQGSGCPVDGVNCRDGGFIVTKRCTIGLTNPPTGDPCFTNADCPGESCVNVDALQFVFAAQFPLSAIAYQGLNYEFFGMAQQFPIPDTGSSPTFGTLLVEIPVGAHGTYTLDFLLEDTRTFSSDSTGISFAVVNLNGATIAIRPQAPVALVGELGFSKDRYVSFDPSPNTGQMTALRVTRVGSATPWYVSCSLQDVGTDGKLSTLVPTAEFCDWMDSVIHVRGCEIVPGNEYLIDATTNDVSFSSTLSVFTTTPQFSASRQFGDVVGSLLAGAWTAPDGLVTTNDIVAVVQKFQLLASAPNISRIDNDGKTPNGILASNDILRAVIAFAGGEFGFGVTDCLTGTCVPRCP